MAADEEVNADSDNEPIAAVGNVREAAINAMKNLLKVDSQKRGGGGTELFRRGQKLVKKFLEQMPPSTEKDKSLELFPAMDAKFESKTCATWRPFVIAQLQLFGEPVEAHLKAHRLKMDDVLYAQRASDAMASGSDFNEERRPMKSKSRAKASEDVDAGHMVDDSDVGPKATKRLKLEAKTAEKNSSARSSSCSTLPSVSEEVDGSDIQPKAPKKQKPETKTTEKSNSACSSSVSEEVQAVRPAVKAAREQAKKNKKESTEMAKLEKLAERAAEKEEESLRARNETADKLKELAKKIGLVCEIRAKEEAAQPLKQENRANEQALELAVPEGKPSTTKSSGSKAQNSRRTKATKSSPSLDRFLKPQKEKMQEQAKGLPQSDHAASSSSSSSEPGAERVIHDPKGYYAALEIAPGAAYAAIKAAYRRLILQHHPDKGGSTEAFRKVQDAYVLLSDDAERAKYDRNSSAQAFAGDRDEGVDATQPSAETLQSRAAKIAFANLLAMPKESWKEVLLSIDSEIIKLMASSCEKCAFCFDAPARTENKRKRNSSVGPDTEEPKQEEFSGKGLWREGRGWVVQVAWRSFKVRSLSALPDLEQAINLHIALVDVRRLALNRHREFLAELKEVGVNAQYLRDLDDCPVMLHEEMQTLMREDPFVRLHFCTDLSKTAFNPRVQVPFTPSFKRAMKFRAFTRRVLQNGGDIPTAKAKMSEEARQDREEYAQRFKDAASQVSQEAHRRAILDNAKRSAIEDQAKANLLCLKQTSAEEDTAAWKAEMEKQSEEHKKELLRMQVQMQASMEATMQACSERQAQTLKVAFEEQKLSLEEQLQSVKKDAENQKALRDEEKARNDAEEARRQAQDQRLLSVKKELEEVKCLRDEEEKARREAQEQLAQQQQPASHGLLQNNRNHMLSKRVAEEDAKCKRYMEETLRAMHRGKTDKQRALDMVRPR